MRPVSAASVAVVRIALGSLLAWSMVRYVARGWVTEQLTGPSFHVTYPGLWWVQPLPAPWMHVVVLVVAAAAVALALGWHTRVAAAVALVGFCWVEFIDAATYLNHYELVTLMLAWCIVLPMATTWSLDRRAGRVSGPRTVPVLAVWLLRAQLAVVYVFAGLAKVNHEWLVRAEPLHTWLAARADLPLIGPVVGRPWAAPVASWAGMLFDLCVVPLLCVRRTRPFAYAAVVAFHLVTWRLFPSIGVFPFVMIALTPVFFDPDWPRRAWGRLAGGTRRAESTSAPDPAPASRPPLSRIAVVAVVVVAIAQVVVPLRHVAAGGDVRWDEVHYRWSWRVLLNERAGSATLDVVDPVTGERTRVRPEEALAPHQARYVSSRPEALRQFAHFVADERERSTGVRPQVFVTAWLSVNGSERALVVDPTVDLAAQRSSWLRPDWVTDPPWRDDRQ